MKLIELKKIAKQTDYRIKRAECDLTLFRDVGNNGAIVNKILIDLYKESLVFINNIFCDEKDLQMIKATVEFAETPVSDREVDMKNYLVHKFMRGGKNLSYPGYLMQCHATDLMYIGNDILDGHSYSCDRNTFTMEEIEKIKKENNTKLKDFYIIPDTDKNRRILFSINCEADFNIKDFELAELEESEDLYTAYYSKINKE